jgi:hypothetical protein
VRSFVCYRYDELEFSVDLVDDKSARIEEIGQLKSDLNADSGFYPVRRCKRKKLMPQHKKKAVSENLPYNKALKKTFSLKYFN